jgi:hypothetical protein
MDMNQVQRDDQAAREKDALFQSAGAFTGLLILLSLRLEYYEMMGYMPNMAPQIAFFFSPLLLAILLVAVWPLELLLKRYWLRPQTKMQSFCIGAGHATLLIWWAFPDHWCLMIALNPITMRLLLQLHLLRS